MKWLKWILAFVFDCVHRHTTWPHRDRRGLDYVCCLDCGRELPYSTLRMSIVTIQEQIEDRTFGRQEDCGNMVSSAIARFSRRRIRVA